MRPLGVCIYAFGSQSCASRLDRLRCARLAAAKLAAHGTSGVRRASERPRPRTPHSARFAARASRLGDTPLPAPTFPSPSRRFAPRCFVGRIRPPRLATCSAAHATNRVAACRSARRSTPRVASSASKRSASFAPFCATPPSAAPLSFRRARK